MARCLAVAAIVIWFLLLSPYPTSVFIAAVTAALTLPITLTATISYMVVGWNAPGLPDFSLGYVYIPGTLSLMIPGVIMAVVGARLAHWSGLPTALVKKSFAVFGLFVGFSILTKTLWG